MIVEVIDIAPKSSNNLTKLILVILLTTILLPTALIGLFGLFINELLIKFVTNNVSERLIEKENSLMS